MWGMDLEKKKAKTQKASPLSRADMSIFKTLADKYTRTLQGTEFSPYINSPPSALQMLVTFQNKISVIHYQH